MKLFYAQGACSLAVHIMLEELGNEYQSVKVSLQDKSVLSQYNPLGYVPVLVLDDNTIMTEATCLLQYLSATNDFAFMPKTLQERYECIEWLTFISTEMHKTAAPLFHKDVVSEGYLKFTEEKIGTRLDFLEKRLKENAFIMGDTYTVADMYALAILRIYDHLGISLDPYPSILNLKKELEESTLIKKIIEFEANDTLITEPDDIKQSRSQDSLSSISSRPDEESGTFSPI